MKGRGYTPGPRVGCEAASLTLGFQCGRNWTLEKRNEKGCRSQPRRGLDECEAPPRSTGHLLGTCTELLQCVGEAGGASPSRPSSLVKESPRKR